MFVFLCWIGIVVSVILLLFGLVVAVAGLMHSEGEAAVTGGIVLCMGLGLGYLSGRGAGWIASGGEPAKPEGSVTQEVQPEDPPLDSWKGKIRDWQSRQGATQRILAKLEQDKQELVAKLRQVGIRSSADLKGKPTAIVHADELHEVAKQIAATKRKLEEREEDIIRMESAVRRLERLRLLKEVGESEEEAAELARTIADLDDKLSRASGVKDAGHELKSETILDSELREARK